MTNKLSTSKFFPFLLRPSAMWRCEKNCLQLKNKNKFLNYFPISNISKEATRKTHLPVKIALSRQVASLFLSQPTRGWPRRKDRGSFAATRTWPQNHRFFRAKQFYNCLQVL